MRNFDGVLRILGKTWRDSRMRSISSASAAVLLLTGTPRAQCLNWSTEFSNGPDGSVWALASYDEGSGPNLFVGGFFGGVSGSTNNLRYLARWDGTTWSQVAATSSGGGLSGGDEDGVHALTVFDDGTGPALYVGGSFSNAGGVPGTTSIARWNGLTWSSVGGGLGVAVNVIFEFDDENGPALYAGCAGATVRKWNGTSWSIVSQGFGGGGVAALATFDDGTGPALYAGGNFPNLKRIAKWNGSTWATLGSGVGEGDNFPWVTSMVSFDEGSGPALFVGGLFWNASGVPGTFGLAKWDGTAWSSIFDRIAQTYAMCLYDDGSGGALYVGGEFQQPPGIPSSHVARWDGAAWTGLGSGPSLRVYALAVGDPGSGMAHDLYAGGDFGQAAEIDSRNIARWRGCSSPIDTICFGDGTVADCPCSNLAALGRGCLNSIGLGARLATSGSPVPDTLMFQVTDERPTALTIFLQGNELVSSSADFGDGLRCAGGDLKRLYVKSASAGAASAPQPGDPSVTARSAALGDPIAPGSTRYYQTYYRDPDPNFCTATNGGNTFNSSNGVRVVW